MNGFARKRRTKAGGVNEGKANRGGWSQSGNIAKFFTQLTGRPVCVGSGVLQLDISYPS